MTHPPFSPPRAALRWEAGARRGCAHRERPLPVFRLGGWPADWGGSAAPGGMMLRRGPWPWRARLLQTPGTQGRTHPQPPMPQVKPEPGGGGGSWGEAAGKVCVGQLPRERKPGGRDVHCVLLAPRFRAREDPDKWSPGPRKWAPGSKVGVTPRGRGKERPGRKGRASAHHLG